MLPESCSMDQTSFHFGPKNTCSPSYLQNMGVCRKMFKRNKDMIFEQAFAQSHSTNTNQEFMDEHFPAHTHALEIRRGARAVFGPKWNDFWSIERLWGIMSRHVYRNPRPTHISAVMSRLREEVRNTDSKTLTKLVHELPTK